jgi:hypothetical protein
MTALTLATFSISHHAFAEASRTTCRDLDWNESLHDSVISSRGRLAEPRYSRWNGRRRSQMQVAISHDAVPADRSAETHEPSAAKQRRGSTTATLVAVAVCAILAKGHLLEATTSSHNAAVTQNAGTAPVTIVAPEFCKDQTWPYIDSRCLRRVDNPAPAAPQATVAPAMTAAATPAPSAGSGNTVAATPTKPETIAATNAPSAAAAPNPTDTRAQVIQSVFPTAAPSATPDTSANPAIDTYQRTGDVSQHHRPRHWNNQFGFFGFRF